MLPVWLPDPITSDPARAVHYTLLWGLEGVVLRGVGPGARVPDVNEAALWRFAEAELEVAAVDPGLFEGPATARAAWLNDLARLPETLAFCARIGCRRVLVGALPEAPPLDAAPALREAAALAARHGIALAVRNEGDGRDTAAALAEVLAAHPALEACWDPATALAAGEAPADGLERLAGRVGLVVVRDGEARRGVWAPAPPGEGAVSWPDVLTALARARYAGPLALDLSGFRPKDGLRQASALIGMIREARRSAA